MKTNTGRQRICARHRTARQPFEAICVIACSTIAAGNGISAKSTPIRISPPAMPNRPDRNAVATINSPSAAIISGVMTFPLASPWTSPCRHFCLACRGCANRVILPWHQFS
jgi:hypothetical protein